MGSDICIISQYWEPDFNGDVTRLRSAIDCLRGLGRTVTLIAGAPHYPSGDRKGNTRWVTFEESAGLRIIRLRMPGLPHSTIGPRLVQYLWFCLGAIPLVIAYGRSRHIWAFSQRAFSTYTALPNRLLWGSIVVSDITDIWPEALVNTRHAFTNSLFFRLSRVFALVAYRTSDRITVMTAAQRNILANGYGVSFQKISLIPSTAEPLPPGSERMPFTVLYYGNVGRNYDFTPVVEAAQKLQKEGVQFVVKGDGESFPQLVRASKGIQNLLVYRESLSEEELRILISGAGALILPMAHQEYEDVSFPIKFVEYLWSGKPIIYVGSGYPAELIRECDVGIAIREGDVSSLVSATSALSKDPSRRSNLGRNAKELAARSFSEESFRKSLAEVFLSN